MIRHTHQDPSQHMVVAYSDNASVMEGGVVSVSAGGPDDGGRCAARVPRVAGRRCSMC
jgi:hypothetical protein